MLEKCTMNGEISDGGRHAVNGVLDDLEES